MKRILRLLASLWALATAGLSVLPAASPSAAGLPVLSLVEIQAQDSGIYAAQVAAINAVMKSKFGVDPFLRLYLGDAAGNDTGTVFAVSRGESFAALSAAVRHYQTDPELTSLRMSLDTVRKLGPRTLLKAVRFDGAHAEAWLYNTYAAVSDEPGYLNALQELTVLLKDHDFADANLNVYRVIAGRSDYTHLVSFNLPSSERLAALLDAVASEAWVAQWLGSSARFRTIVRNGTYREISR